MRAHHADIRTSTAAMLLALSLAAPSMAQVAVGDRVSGIQVANFGRVDEGYYRGAQPKDHDYADLAALGIRTVVDLTRNSETVAAEPGMVVRAGMKSFRIPMSTQSTPRAGDVDRFLKLVNDPANRPVFVHCVGGRHRTGAMTAVYRMTRDGWAADRAYQEMKAFRFEGFPDHWSLRRFVFDYYAELKRARSVDVPPAVAFP
jgi:protein tyrosine/serine phosphatase